MSSTPLDAYQIGSVIQRVNRLGTATERLFSRLYKGIGRRTRAQTSQPQGGAPNVNNNRDLDIERLQGVLATIEEGIIMQDNEGRVVLVNRAARELLGSIKAFWESELGTLFSDYRNITTVDSEIFPLSEPTRVQINNRIVGARLGAVADESGNRLGTLIVLRDVTNEVLSERLKDQFVTAITHELRTPMAVIKGVSEVLIAQATDGKLNRRLLQTLSRNVDVLDRMIVELLDISELNDSNFALEQEIISLEELLWNVVNGLRPEILRAKLDVSVMLRNTASLRLNADAQRLRWALGHLIQNAVRYTEPGGHIVVTATPSDEGRVALQVVDTGVGISERDLPHIFERFYRGEPRTATGKLLDPRGLGQGLYIARKVTEAHDGYLSVNSQPGRGSVFTMVLPLAR